MRNQNGAAHPSTGDESKGTVVDCELCILGGGIAGLNALFVASRLLSPSDKIVLVDRNLSPAGMWQRVYSYVRLHQPHPVFTAGDLAWRGRLDPQYLPSKSEVVAHLTYCFEALRDGGHVEPRFGYEYLSHEESTSGSRPVTVRCRSHADGSSLTIRARRLIKAFGYNVQPNPPLQLSSQAVSSVSPDSCDLLGPALGDPSAPVYIVGGGKTGMDTAHTLVTQRPNKPVRLLIGAGTMFIDRAIAMPHGSRRYWAGATPLEIFLDTASRFDGRNEHDVMPYFRRRYTVSLDDRCQRFMFGVLSQQENQQIARGVREVIRDHLVDVVDTATGPKMRMRSGAERPIEAGATVVNATGYLARDATPYEPYLSERGHVLSIQPTSAVHFLSSQSAYFLSHAFLTGMLRELPLYELDFAGLLAASRDTFGLAGMAMTLHNSAVFLKALPKRARDENGLDFLRLYPPHRQLLAVGKLITRLMRHPTGFTDTMDVVRDRFGVRLGRLQHTRSPRASAAAQATLSSADRG